MAKIIIGIHGLGNKPDSVLLEEWWVQSIKEGLGKSGLILKKIPFKLIYWADVLHSKPENPDITDKDDPLFLSEPYVPSNSKNMKQEVKTLYKKILRFIERHLDKIFLKDDMTLKFEKVTERIINNYFEDLSVYYSNDCKDQNNPNCIARLAIRRRLYDALKHYKTDDILLISHSMGSIIAYDVLINNENELNVNTLVTLGSPLGIPMIASRIFAEQKAVRIPKNIKNRWHNLSDPEDLVAIDHSLNDDFSHKENSLIIEDIMVKNDYIVNKNANPHKIYGYLRTTEMVKIISDFLEIKQPYIIRHYHNLKNKIKNVLKTKLKRR